MNYQIIAAIVAILSIGVLVWLNSGAFDANRAKFKKSQQAKKKRLLSENDGKRNAKSHPLS